MESSPDIFATFNNKLIILGFGSIGQAILPLIFKHTNIKPEQVSIISKKDDGVELAKKYGVGFHVFTVTKDNYKTLLDTKLTTGDFLLNLSVDISSIDLIQLCQEKGTLYLDTCIEPWAGGYTDTSLPSHSRSNYALRHNALALKVNKQKTTAVITHGANPGLVSHFVKQALVNMAKDVGLAHTSPTSREDWAKLAFDLGIKAIHIAERDTQIGKSAKRPGEFVNTWSIDGFISEGSQPAELGWGSHERHWPHDANEHEYGCKSAIYLNRPGASTRVRTWTPLAGQFHGFLITHGESISISDFLTLKKDDVTLYRPTVHYAYHPCDDAVSSLHELAGREWEQQVDQRLLFDEIVDGIDELGVLLMGGAKGAYWYGSQLSIHEARELAPHNTATSLQVAIGALAAISWAMNNPEAGITEPDEIDYEYVMNICRPYLGTLCGHYTDWNPIRDREKLFPETIDKTDPWQFINIRVN